MDPSALSVLVVDDDTATREALAELLSREGFATTQAADGREALDQLEGGEEPCVVLLDWVMPRMDGESFLTARDSAPHLAAIPVVVMSATHDPAGDPRIQGFLAKPFRVDQALMSLKHVCQTSCPDSRRERRRCQFKP